MSPPLTILHLTHDGRGAGSSISIALLARAQLRAGHRVIVGCPAGRWLERLLTDTGVHHVPMPFLSRGEAAGEIERLAVMARVDVVNAHSSRDRAATRWLRLRRRLPAALVMTRRAMPMSSPLSAILSGFAADRTIAVSRPVARALVRRGTPPWRVAVVPNAVDLERIDRIVTRQMRDEALQAVLDGRRRTEGTGDPGRVDERPWLTPHGPMIGVVSRPKDHAVLIEALRYVTTRVTLVSLGFDPPSGFRLPSSVHQAAWLPFQDDPLPFYQLFDVVALPTRHEGLSQGLLEAMALGKAVVTTRSGGNTDLIDDGAHGLLVPPRDPRALAAALERLLADPALRTRLGDAARERVRAEFTIERTAAGTESVYRAALARR